MKKKFYFKYNLPKYIVSNYKRKRYNNERQVTIIEIASIEAEPTQQTQKLKEYISFLLDYVILGTSYIRRHTIIIYLRVFERLNLEYYFRLKPRYIYC